MELRSPIPRRRAVLCLDPPGCLVPWGIAGPRKGDHPGKGKSKGSASPAHRDRPTAWHTRSSVVRARYCALTSQVSSISFGGIGFGATPSVAQM